MNNRIDNAIELVKKTSGETPTFKVLWSAK